MGFNNMPKEKRKKGFFDLFGPDEDFLFDAKSFSEGGSGYSISVNYDEKGKPVGRILADDIIDAMVPAESSGLAQGSGVLS